NLIGIENAIEVVISNPVKQNRMLKPQQAKDMGLFDEIFPASRFLEQSIGWADQVVNHKLKVQRPHAPGKIERATKWPIAIKIARDTLTARLGTAARSPYVALDLLAAAKDGDRQAGFEREDAALAELIAGDQFVASL